MKEVITDNKMKCYERIKLYINGMVDDRLYINRVQARLGAITWGMFSNSLPHHLFPGRIKLRHISGVVLGKVKTSKGKGNH
jgi:hypothetical protein